MNKIITPSPIEGTIAVPPSKSVSHRAVICQALSDGVGTVRGVLLSEDILATADAMVALGAQIQLESENDSNLYTLTIAGCGRPIASKRTIDCHESGSTVRFIIPIAAIDADETVFVGRGRLPQRPLKPYEDNLTAHGITWTTVDPPNGLPLKLSGALSGGKFAMPGDISSQFITGLLFALPMLSQDSEVTVTTDMQSAPYVAITLGVLSKYGVHIQVSEDFRHYLIPGNQHYAAADYTVEGDYSQAAFWLAMGAIGHPVTVTGLSADTAQGDAAIIDFIRQMGGTIKAIEGGYRSEPSELHGITMDVSQCPDLVPVLSVLAACADGTSQIVHAERLRLKESDRLAVMAELLSVLGVPVEQTDDGLIITGVPRFVGGTVDAHNDHRIAMAAAVAAVRADKPVTVIGADSVKKSYPDFWQDYGKLGGKLS